MRSRVIVLPLLASELFLEVVSVEHDGSGKEICKVWLIVFLPCELFGKKRLVFKIFHRDDTAGTAYEATFFLDESVSVCLVVDMVIDNAGHVAIHPASLSRVSQVVVN